MASPKHSPDASDPDGIERAVAANALVGWPTQTEAAVQLATNERTVRRWIAAGRLRAATRPVTGRKPLTVIDPAGIERMRAERQPPTVLRENAPETYSEAPGSGALQSAAIARTEPAALAGTLAGIFADAFRALTPPAPKLFLDLAAAAGYSGLPKRLVARLVAEKRLAAIRHAGRIYIRRADLDALDAGG